MNAQRRHELTDAQWARIAPLLPPQQPPTGRPNHDHRQILNGILWRLRTGAAWRDLPERYGNWQTVYSRFRRWRQVSIWDRLLLALQREAAHDDALDGTLALLDGSSVRAHQDAAGARKKGGPDDDQALGRSRGGWDPGGAPQAACFDRAQRQTGGGRADGGPTA